MRPAPSPTAGPWRVIGRTIVGAPTVRSAAPFVAAVRRKADAPLIAAAPELAETLRDFVAAFDYTNAAAALDGGILHEQADAARALLTRIGAQL